jgi:hypothetical protein
MKIGAKLAILISIFNILGIGILTGATLLKSRQELSRLVDEQALSAAARSGEQIKNWIDEYMIVVRTLTKNNGGV